MAQETTSSDELDRCAASGRETEWNELQLPRSTDELRTRQKGRAVIEAEQ